jgi:DNA polymerase I
LKIYESIGNGLLSLDVETDGTKISHGNRICGIGLGYRSSEDSIETCYIPIRHEVWNAKENIFGEVEVVDNLPPSETLDLLRPILSSPEHQVISHNMGFETQALMVEGVCVKNHHCTWLMSYLNSPDTPNGLKPLLKRLFNEDLTPLRNLKKWLSVNKFGKDEIKKWGYKYVPLEVIAPYTEILDCAGDIKLFEYLKPRLSQHRKLYKVEWELTPVLAEMEMKGIPCSIKELENIETQVVKELEKTKEWMFRLAGSEFLPSPQKIAQVLYEDLGLDIPTKRGKGLTDSETLKHIDHPLAKAVEAYRALDKIQGTYITSLKEELREGRIHSEFIQIPKWGDQHDTDESKGGASTGRLSSAKPNVHNIGKPREIELEHKKIVISLRSTFRISDDHIEDWQFLLFDKSQIELRILAEESGDENMLKALKEGKDLHALAAEKIHGKTKDTVDPSEYHGSDPLNEEERKNWVWENKYRSPSKTTQFAICYGMSPRRYSIEHNIPVEKAYEFYNKYFAGFPRVKQLNDHLMRMAEKTGYVMTKYGRRVPLTERQSYKALNAKIQSTAADMFKIVIVRVHNVLKKNKLESRLVNNIHDELIVEHYKRELQVPKLVLDEMQRWPEFKVPIVADVKIAHPSWGDKRSLTEEEKKLYET